EYVYESVCLRYLTHVQFGGQYSWRTQVQTAEQALMELRQAHLDLRKKQDEATVLRRATRAVAQRGGGPPPPTQEASPPAPDEAAEVQQPDDLDNEEQDAAAEPASEEQQKLEEEEQRKLIGYNEATKTFKRFRPDFKCGSRVPLLPDDEVVECDRLSVTPCCSALGWCGRTKGHCRCATCIDYRKECAALQTLYTAGHKVELAATKLGPGFPGFQAYHTSVKVDDMEYSFSGEGIVVQRGLPSHMRLPDTPEVVYVGLTSLSGDVMQKHLTGFFKRGSYDLLRKNCNSFSDCALYFLLDMRLDPSYKGLEQLGHMADRQAGIVQAVTEGNYRPNPNADTFSVAATIEAINKLKDSPAFRFS
ncbi:Protein spinster, partial [Durusdinium trenchii]